MRSDDTLLEFPCDFQVKAMGRPDTGGEDGDFSAFVTSLVAAHVEDLDASRVTAKPSSGGKYLAVTVRFEASSREQLDAIYQSLSDEPRVLVAL